MTALLPTPSDNTLPERVPIAVCLSTSLNLVRYTNNHYQQAEARPLKCISLRVHCESRELVPDHTVMISHRKSVRVSTLLDYWPALRASVGSIIEPLPAADPALPWVLSRIQWQFVCSIRSAETPPGLLRLLRYLVRGDEGGEA